MWEDRLIDKWMDGWMVGWMDRQIKRQIDIYKMDYWIDWIDGQICRCKPGLRDRLDI